MKQKINKLIAYVGSDINKVIGVVQKLLRGSSCTTLTDLYNPGVFKQNYKKLDNEWNYTFIGILIQLIIFSVLKLVKIREER